MTIDWLKYVLRAYYAASSCKSQILEARCSDLFQTNKYYYYSLFFQIIRENAMKRYVYVHHVLKLEQHYVMLLKLQSVATD